MKAVRRGEIWLVAFDPTVGSEIKKTRPAVVISPPEMHDYLRTLIVAPITSKGHPADYRISLHFSGIDGLILLDQIKTVDRRRLIRRLGVADDDTLHSTQQTLAKMFAP